MPTASSKRGGRPLASSILKTQYEFAKRQGWIPFFQHAARVHNFPVADLIAMASRETDMRNIAGDFHDGRFHGFGLLQVDIRTDAKFCSSGEWKSPERSIMRGTEILAEKRQAILSLVGKARQHTFNNGKKSAFVGASIEGEDLRAATIAAHNCGGAAYYHYSKGRSVDTGTTGANYSEDVLLRSALFAKWLTADGFDDWQDMGPNDEPEAEIVPEVPVPVLLPSQPFVVAAADQTATADQTTAASAVAGVAGAAAVATTVVATESPVFTTDEVLAGIDRIPVRSLWAKIAKSVAAALSFWVTALASGQVAWIVGTVIGVVLLLVLFFYLRKSISMLFTAYIRRRLQS